MNYQKLIVDVPPLSDEAAAVLQRFLYDLMHAIDEQYYPQIERHYIGVCTEKIIQDHSDGEMLEDPPF